MLHFYLRRIFHRLDPQRQLLLIQPHKLFSRTRQLITLVHLHLINFKIQLVKFRFSSLNNRHYDLLLNRQNIFDCRLLGTHHPFPCKQIHILLFLQLPLQPTLSHLLRQHCQLRLLLLFLKHQIHRGRRSHLRIRTVHRQIDVLLLYPRKQLKYKIGVELYAQYTVNLLVPRVLYHQQKLIIDHQLLPLPIKAQTNTVPLYHSLGKRSLEQHRFSIPQLNHDLQLPLLTPLLNIYLGSVGNNDLLQFQPPRIDEPHIVMIVHQILEQPMIVFVARTRPLLALLQLHLQMLVHVKNRLADVLHCSGLEEVRGQKHGTTHLTILTVHIDPMRRVGGDKLLNFANSLHQIIERNVGEVLVIEETYLSEGRFLLHDVLEAILVSVLADIPDLVWRKGDVRYQLLNVVLLRVVDVKELRDDPGYRELVQHLVLQLVVVVRDGGNEVD